MTRLNLSIPRFLLANSFLTVFALLHSAAPACAQEHPSWPKLKEVIVVSKTHFDIGYTDLASRVVNRYRTSMADQALKMVDESRRLPPDEQFQWTLAGWPMAQILWPGQTPERRRRFLAAMRAGRMAPHALPFSTHTESLDLEDLTRGFCYSVELARLAGRPIPTAGKMTDVTSHTRALATVLAQAGVKFFHLGSNEACSHLEVPLMYWWEGPDGSRVLTMFSSSYGSSLCPPPNWPYKTWLYMWMTSDNHGPPNPREVAEVFARAKKELPGVRVHFGQMSDFADELLSEKPDLPVVRGDAPDTWIHGIGSMPIETQLAHVTRPRIAALESLDTLLRVWGLSPGPVKSIVREAYENTLLFGEHTWGPDVGRYAGYSYGEEWKKRLARGDYKFLTEGFNQKRAYAHKAAALVEPALAERLAELAKAVNAPGRRIVVFNPLPWTRDSAVDVPWTGSASGVVDAANRETVSAAVDGGRLQFVARDLPPLGYRTYRVPRPSLVVDAGRLQFVAKNLPPLGYRTCTVPPPSLVVAVTSDSTSRRIENEFLRVTLDPARCGICSIIDKRTGRELVNAKSPYALGEYLYERFDADQGAAFAKAYVVSPRYHWEMLNQNKPKLPPAKEHPYCATTARNATLEIRRSAVSATAIFKAAPQRTIPDATQLQVTLYTGLPWLDLKWTIPHKTPDPWPEAGWLCFPIRADDPTFQLARLGSIVNPATDLLPGTNHEVFCLNGGLLVNGADGGRTGICPIDPQLVSLEHPGLWRYSRDFVAHKPDVFVMLFNNVYSTNFAQWIDGTWSSRVRLWVPGKGQSNPTSLIGSSWEARLPCLAAVSDAPAGKLPPAAAGLTVTRNTDAAAQPSAPAAKARLPRGLLVTAFGPNPYGEGTLLRLWEQAGNSGRYTVQLPAGMKAAVAQPCDLRSQPTGPPLPISSQGTFEAKVKAMAPVSFLLSGAGNS